MVGKELKRNSDYWRELADIGYFSGEMPANIDELPPDLLSNIHHYLIQRWEEAKDIPQ